MKGTKKKLCAIMILCCWLFMIAIPADANLNFGFGFTIIEAGPISLDIGISTPMAILFGASILLGEFGFFDGGSSRGGYYNDDYSYGPTPTPRPTPTPQPVRIRIETVEISSNDVIPKQVMEIKLRHLFDPFNRIPLGGNRYLELGEDGRLAFTNTLFQGYMYLHYDLGVTVFDSHDEPVLIIKYKENKHFALLLKKGENHDELTQLLFGIVIR